MRVDLVFKPDRHMVLDYTLRVREQREIITRWASTRRPASCMILDPAALRALSGTLFYDGSR